MVPSRFAPLLLCLLLSVPGLAQTSESGGRAPPPVSLPPLVPAPSHSQPPEESPQTETGETDAGQPHGEIVRSPWRPEREEPSPAVPRLLLEFLGGTVGATVGIIPGSILALSGLCFDCSDNSESRIILGIALVFAGAAGGAAVGIVGGASLVRGQGQYGSTMAGAAIGTLTGLVSGLALASTLGDAALIPVALGPIIGGIIAYEISHANAISDTSYLAAAGTRVVPVVSVSPRGGVIGGLAGSF